MVETGNSGVRRKWDPWTRTGIPVRKVISFLRARVGRLFLSEAGR